MGKLTNKQEKFCQYFASGMSAVDSYTSAYNTQATTQVKYNESHKLLKNPAIMERIKELNFPLENHIAHTSKSERQQQIDFILERIELCKQKDDEQSIIRYTDMLNKIFGTYKEDNTGSNEENKLENIDTDKLLKLIG